MHKHPRYVLPVIHYRDRLLALQEADLAFRAGADGVFLISHNDKDDELPAVAQAIKHRHPSKQVGVNLLSQDPLSALRCAEQFDLDMVWADSPGVTSAGWTPTGAELAAYLRSGSRVTFFGSVAFKYQLHEPEPGRAAALAALNHMLPTTSGAATGSAPSVTKVRTMSEALSGGPLAVASGMTCANVSDYLPYVTHFLVATGVSLDMHHFDEAALADFVSLVRGTRE